MISGWSEKVNELVITVIWILARNPLYSWMILMIYKIEIPSWNSLGSGKNIKAKEQQQKEFSDSPSWRLLKDGRIDETHILTEYPGSLITVYCLRNSNTGQLYIKFWSTVNAIVAKFQWVWSPPSKLFVRYICKENHWCFSLYLPFLTFFTMLINIKMVNRTWNRKEE